MYSEALISGNNLSIGEALKMGGETTVIGLTIVFSVLIILMIVLMLFKVIFYRDPAKQAKKAIDTPTEEQSVVSDSADDMDESELIAVLTAAIAASLNTSTYNLQIKSYRRTDNKMPAWNRAGVTETINNRF